MMNHSSELIEREAPLRALDGALREAVQAGGRVVLVAGEAGIGKTSLLRAFVSGARGATVWWGECDALETPHPLAPLHDIARSADVAFKPLLGEGNRVALFESVLGEMTNARGPVLAIIEDAHWADDATLDLLKFLGRRIDRTCGLLVISYRDDEVTATHPLRRVIGELPPSSVTRIDVPRLSPAAVTQLARSALRSSEGLYDATQGNPFFVSELLRHGVEGVPRNVQDLVLARYARLSPDAQAIVNLVSLVPARAEMWLVARLATAEAAEIGACLNAGLLGAGAETLHFRHELARVAIETSLSPPVARALHGAMLRALLEDERQVPLARIVHHATRAGDDAAVRRYAPEAARQARDRGAHREAAAHYRTALTHAGQANTEERAEWLEGYAAECQAIGSLEAAVAAHLELDALCVQGGDVAREADNLSRLALAYVATLRNAAADDASRRAIALLEDLAPSRALASAYRVEAHLRMLNRDYRASVEWSIKAIATAERFAARDILSAALCTLGSATLFVDYDEGCAHLLRSLDIALADGHHETAANAYSNLGSGSGESFRLPEAKGYLERAIAFANDHEIDVFRNYSLAWLALCDVYAGRWDSCEERALAVVEIVEQRIASLVVALVALGRLRARRGDANAAATLDEALRLALTTHTLQRIAPVRAARAEAAFLRGDREAVVEEAKTAHEMALARAHPWFAGELAYWLHRAGAGVGVDAIYAEPFALQIAGRYREAAEAWRALGCPYERAAALAECSGEDQLAALAMFERLGARPAATALRKRLRAARVRGVPRGAHAETRANPHDLTARELEALTLLCEGLRNSEIAERL
jgi:AAA ATPase-like protein